MKTVLALLVAVAVVVGVVFLAPEGRTKVGKAAEIAPPPPADIASIEAKPEIEPAPNVGARQPYRVQYQERRHTLLGLEVPFVSLNIGYKTCQPVCTCGTPTPCLYHPASRPHSTRCLWPYQYPNVGVGFGGGLGLGHFGHGYGYGGLGWGHGYRVTPMPHSHYTHQWRPHHYGASINPLPRPDSHYIQR